MVTVASVLFSQLRLKGLASWCVEPGRWVFALTVVLSIFCWWLIAAWAIFGVCRLVFAKFWRKW